MLRIRNWMLMGAFALAASMTPQANATLLGGNDLRFSEPGFAVEKSLTILQLGAGSLDPLEKNPEELAPSVGISRRYESRDAAVDVSASFCHRGKEVIYSAPRVMYLQFLDPDASNSLYLGGGLGFGGIENRDPALTVTQKFHGLFAHGAIGYEMRRHDHLRTLVQIEVSQALIATSQRGDHPMPAVAMTLGWGF